MLAIIALYALCATSFTLCKSLLLSVKPLFFIGIRMLIAGALLVAWSSYRNKLSLRIARKDWWLMLQVVLFHIYGAYIFDLWALQSISSSKSALLFNLSPFIAALFSYLIFSETLSRRQWIGLGIGCLGIAPQMAALTQGSLGIASADLIMLVAVTSSVYGWMVVKQLLDRGYAIAVINGLGMLGGGALALLTSYLVEGWHANPILDFWPFVIQLALIILVINIGFYTLYGNLLRSYSATLLSFAGFITPFFAALYGWILLGESLSPSFIVSLCIVSIGLYLFYSEELASARALAKVKP